MAMCPVPAEDEEDGREDVDGKYDSTYSEEEGRQDPRGCISMGWIKRLRSPQDRKDSSHALQLLVNGGMVLDCV